MAKDEIRTIGVEPALLRSAIVQLDESADNSDPTQTFGRKSDRFSYRVRAMTVEFIDHSGGWVKYVIPSRNLSRSGCSILTGHYVYQGTRARVHLVSLQNHTQAVAGVVMRCRYLTGTGRVYETGIRFESPIDIALFHRGASCHRILVADDDPSVHKILPHLLSTLKTEIKSVSNGQEAVDAARNQSFDVILMDLEMPEKDGTAAMIELRELGFTRPIVAITANSDDATQKRCLEAGFSNVCSKPLYRESLTDLIKSIIAEPIVSSLVNEKPMARLIDNFVAELPGQLRELERAFITREVEALETASRVLKANAGTHGFDVISQAAESLEGACTEKKDQADIRRILCDLTRLCHAARPVTVVERRDTPDGTSAESPSA